MKHMSSDEIPRIYKI